MSIELRYAVPAKTTTKAPVLQYRTAQTLLSTRGVIGLPSLVWSEWRDVPTIVVEDAQPLAPLVCPRCKVNRTIEPCPDRSGNCPMVGTAQGSNLK